MKKFAGLLVAVVGGVWATANYVPGAWSYVPQPVIAQIPAAAVPYLQAYFNFPAPKQVAASPDQAAQGGGAGKGPGAGGPGKGMAGGGPGGAGGQGRGPGGGGPGAGGKRATPVTVANVARQTVPFRIESIGTVQPVASVTVRSRVDSQIESILFADGATVKQGDVLAKLDSRVIEAQLRQAEANLARDRATLELTRSTLKRGEELAAQSFATKQRLDENRAAVTAQEALVRADEAQVEVLRTQLTFYTIHAPISGKAGLANIKPGNMARSSDGAIAITTINQMSPIYVSFNLPQRYFQELREALKRGSGTVLATPQGSGINVEGKLELIENAMDNATGTIGVRAVFENDNEALWPGLIVGLKVSLREEADQVVVPREAVQMSQRGNFVFVVADGVARMQPITVGRSIDKLTVVTNGLKGNEQVIIDGQLLVVEGAPVEPRPAKSSELAPASPAKAL